MTSTPVFPLRDLSKSGRSVLSSTQLRRVSELVTKVAVAKIASYRQSIFLWYLCHLLAFLSWGSGLSLAGTVLSDTSLGQILTIFMGVCSILYPLTKYLDLEGRRSREATLYLFCSNLQTKLEDAANTIQILAGAKESEETALNWDQVVQFISATKHIVEKMEVGSPSFQKTLEDFEMIEKRNARREQELAVLEAVAKGDDDSPSAENVSPPLSPVETSELGVN